MYDFSFLAPCPSSGLIINGGADRIVPTEDVTKLSEKLKAQKGITITHETVPEANHFFERGMDQMIGTVKDYVKRRMVEGGR
jgi:alpha/beta superfamily hydrolase